MEKTNLLLTTGGGTVTLPTMPLNGRQDGGHLLVNPPREVWERSELTVEELINWSFLVAVRAPQGSPASVWQKPGRTASRLAMG